MQRFKIYLLCISIFHYLNGRADVIPKENGIIHYIIVYFEEGFQKNATEYELRVYSDSTSLVKDQIAYSLKNPSPAFRLELDWGKTYFWKVQAFDKKHRLLNTGNPHCFSIIPKIRSVAYEDLRLNVRINNPKKHAGGYLAIDHLNGIYDRNGKPVWMLPSISGCVIPGAQIRDLKFTYEGTITFLADNHPMEIDLEGNILWSPPNPFIFRNDTITFHHDFKKTLQGTYMMLGNKAVYRPLLVDYDEKLQKLKREVKIIDGKPYGKTDIAIVLELDKEGQVLWFWDANEYLQDVDLNYKKTPEGFPFQHAHANALGVNAENTKVYVGFRYISRIVKVDKQTKKVESSYGEKYPSGEAKYANNLFRHQHDANVTDHNSILILNNNTVKMSNNNAEKKPGFTSSILELKDNITASDSVLLWKFDLDFDTLSNGQTASQGNVVELPNSNIFLCAGQMNRLFEVTRSKEVVWDAFTYSLAKNDSVWQPFSNYRGSWVKDIRQNHVLVDVISAEKQKDDILTLVFTVYNISEKDNAFTMEILSDNIPLYKLNTHTLTKNAHTTEKLKIPLTASTTKSLTLRVSSVKNKRVVKNVDLNLSFSLIK
jgi:hypothetical protein